MPFSPGDPVLRSTACTVRGLGLRRFKVPVILKEYRVFTASVLFLALLYLASLGQTKKTN